MNITGDYHTHSKYSRLNHGKNTIKEMAQEAEKKGLKGYAITDHGPNHLLFGVRRKNIDKALKEVEEINKNSKCKVYYGVEANLYKKDGSIDLSKEETEKLGILVVGYHRGCINYFVNPLRCWFNKKKQKEINTLAYIKCLEKYNVDIISHMNEYVKVDCYEVGKKAKEKGTLIEINNRHFRFSDKDMEDLLRSGCSFIISSDSHRKENIAKVDKALEYVKKYNIPIERIANIDKIYK